MIKASEAKAIAQNIVNSKEVTNCISGINEIVKAESRLGKYAATITSSIEGLKSREQKDAAFRVLKDNGYEIKDGSFADQREGRNYKSWTISWS